MASPCSSDARMARQRSGNVVPSENVPVSAELSPFLRDASRADLVLVGDIARALADHQILDDAAVALAQASQPGQEIQLEADRLVGRRLRVIQQGFAQRMLREGLEIGKPADEEMASSLSDGRQDIVDSF